MGNFFRITSFKDCKKKKEKKESVNSSQEIGRYYTNNNEINFVMNCAIHPRFDNSINTK